MSPTCLFYVYYFGGSIQLNLWNQFLLLILLKYLWLYDFSISIPWYYKAVMSTILYLIQLDSEFFFARWMFSYDLWFRVIRLEVIDFRCAFLLCLLFLPASPYLDVVVQLHGVNCLSHFSFIKPLPTFLT